MKKYEKLTKETLEEAVKNCRSYGEVQRYLGKNDKSGGQWSNIKRRIEQFDIDISHFCPSETRAWSKGKSLYKTDEVFAEGSTAKRSVVRKYVIRDNLIPYECAFCGNDGHWMGRKIALELDHINGVFNDHRLENLRFLCPNCHATTQTYAGRNTSKK